jgi:hypothetical protein
MRTFAVIFIVIGGLFGASWTSSISSRRSIPEECRDSPCGLGAICEVSSGGLTICKCPPGAEGDPFVQCRHVGGGLETTQPPRTTQQQQLQTTTFLPKQEAVVDMSRVPIRGDEQASPTTTPQTHFNLPQKRHELTMDRLTGHRDPQQGQHRYYQHQKRHEMTGAHFAGQRDPPRGADLYQDQVISSPSSTLFHTKQGIPFGQPSNQFADFTEIKDPLGKYQRCRSINGITVCADDRYDNEGI